MLHAAIWQGKETTMTTTIEKRIVRTAPGMEFDVSVAGDPGRPLVLMLHGFCVSRHYWESRRREHPDEAMPDPLGNIPG
jgi:pimeloyl-ACP methyl ester carboxylesterase